MQDPRKQNSRYAPVSAALMACLVLTACGVSSPQTPLPSIDRARPATLLNKKQKNRALKRMEQIAETQNQRADQIEPITYKIPEK